MTSMHVWSAVANEKKDWELIHGHSNYEISVVFVGNGIFQCGEVVRTIEAGSAILLPPHIIHRYVSHTPMRIGVIHIENLPKRTEEIMCRLIPDQDVAVFRMSPLDTEQYLILFRQWLRILSQPFRLEEQYKSTWIELFLVFLIQHTKPSHSRFSIAAAADYLRLNLQEEISIASLAGLTGFSESGFRKLFKKLYGLTPKQFQQQCRIAEAKWLLRSTDSSIQTIAEQIGFMNVHSFSFWFQKYTGFPPSRWRKNERQSRN